MILPDIFKTLHLRNKNKIHQQDNLRKVLVTLIVMANLITKYQRTLVDARPCNGCTWTYDCTKKQNP